MHGVKRLFAWMIPRFDKTRFNVTLISLRKKDLSADTLEEWIGMAKSHPGSWWPYWIEWVTKYSGDQIDARTPGATLGIIEDAPGSYVKTKS